MQLTKYLVDNASLHIGGRLVHQTFIRPMLHTISHVAPCDISSHSSLNTFDFLLLHTKVQVFWEGHKNLSQSAACFWHYWVSNIKLKLTSNPWRRLCQIFVAFSDYMNLTSSWKKKIFRFDIKIYKVENLQGKNVFTVDARLNDLINM